MNKSELIEYVAQAIDSTKVAAGATVDAIITGITKALKSGEAITLAGFGTFKVRNRAARAGRNPQTGETIKIKASKTVAFKAGTALKEAVAKSKK